MENCIVIEWLDAIIVLVCKLFLIVKNKCNIKMQSIKYSQGLRSIQFSFTEDRIHMNNFNKQKFPLLILLYNSK